MKPMKLNRLSAALAAAFLFAAVAISPPLAAAKSMAAKSEFVNIKKSGVAANPISQRTESAYINTESRAVFVDRAIAPPGTVITGTADIANFDSMNSYRNKAAVADYTPRYMLEREPTSRSRPMPPNVNLMPPDNRVTDIDSYHGTPMTTAFNGVGMKV